jgi:hypothetical protein
MKTSILTRLFTGALIITVTLTAFSEKTSVNNTTAPKFNAAGSAAKTPAAITYSQLLNQNLRVTYAMHNGVDITEDMNDWTFRFNGDYPGGDAQGWNDVLSVTGSWSMTEGSDNISIMFPSRLSQPAFMSRTWAIGYAGKGAEIVFTSGDGDEVHFISDIQ